jgi:hypothetical protein
MVILHVLNQIAAEGDVDQLKASAYGKKRNFVFDGPLREAQI